MNSGGSKLLFAALFFAAAVEGVVTSSSALGQEYPNKPIRIVTTAAGDSADLVTRLIAPGLSAGLGQPLVVDNRNPVVAPEVAAKALPDGYTLLVGASVMLIGPLLQKAPYDPVNDFLPISLLLKQPNVLVIHPSLPAKSLKELIALAKAKPGVLNYSSAGTGGTTHLAAELLKAMAGVNIVRVNYSSATAAFTALLTGEVQLAFGNAVAVSPYLKSGRLRAIAVTSAEPTPIFPGIPTIAAAGLPGYESGNMAGLYAPAKTPEAIIKRVNMEVVRVLRTPEIKEKFLNIGADVIGSSPAQFAAFIKTEIERQGKLIKDAGIGAQ